MDDYFLLDVSTRTRLIIGLFALAGCVVLFMNDQSFCDAVARRSRERRVLFDGMGSMVSKQRAALNVGASWSRKRRGAVHEAEDETMNHRLPHSQDERRRKTTTIFV
jgi:hypothetical protein